MRSRSAAACLSSSRRAAPASPWPARPPSPPTRPPASDGRRAVRWPPPCGRRARLTSAPGAPPPQPAPSLASAQCRCAALPAGRALRPAARGAPRPTQPLGGRGRALPGGPSRGRLEPLLELGTPPFRGGLFDIGMMTPASCRASFSNAAWPCAWEDWVALARKMRPTEIVVVFDLELAKVKEDLGKIPRLHF